MRTWLPLLLLTACGGGPESYCRALNECYDGSESDYEDCVDEVEKRWEEADADGCGREYARWVDCMGSTAECDGDRLETDPDCEDLRDDYHDCED